MVSESMHTSIHSGSTGNIRHPPRNGLRLTPRSPRGPIALLTPSSARRFGRPRELDACKGAPEPHGFAVRKQARSSVALTASTASRLTFVTRETPLLWRRDGWSKSYISEKRNRSFLEQRASRPNRLDRLEEIALKIFEQRRIAKRLRRAAPLRNSPSGKSHCKRRHRLSSLAGSCAP